MCATVLPLIECPAAHKITASFCAVSAIKLDSAQKLKLRQGCCIVLVTAAALLERSAVAPPVVKSREVNVNRSGKVIVDRHPAADEHHKLITSRESPLAHADHVWSTSVNALQYNTIQYKNLQRAISNIKCYSYGRVRELSCS